MKKTTGSFYLVCEEILPEAIKKTIRVKALLKRGDARTINEAVEKMNLSRSAYYKYKDYIFEPSELTGSRTAVFSMMLDHTPGVLSALLSCISETGASVITISQSPPIHDKASVTVSIDVSGVSVGIDELTSRLAVLPGLDNVKLLAIE